MLDVVNDDTAAPRDGDEQAYIVTAAPGHDIRDLVAKRIVDGGHGLRELRGLEMDLEDIFLQLTTQEAEA